MKKSLFYIIGALEGTLLLSLGFILDLMENMSFLFSLAVLAVAGALLYAGAKLINRLDEETQHPGRTLGN